MSTIGGIGSYGGISLTGFRNKPGEEQGGLAQLARNRAFAGCRYRRAALASYCVNPRGPGLVMGFAPYEERAIEDAARVVAHILRG